MIEQDVVGMEKQAAIDLIHSKGMKSRVRSEDGVGKMGTCDFRKDRVNLYVEKGKITKASIG